MHDQPVKFLLNTVQWIQELQKVRHVLHFHKNVLSFTDEETA